MPNETAQFPLALLAYGKNKYDRLETAICHSIATTGMHRQKVLTATLVEAELAGLNFPKANARINASISAAQVKTLALGCNFCGLKLPETIHVAASRWQRHQDAEVFLQSWWVAGRTTAWTRVPMTMLLEARDGSPATYRRFTALCAVNAAIGSKPFAVVTRNRVRAGMLGYTSSSLLFERSGKLTDTGVELLAAHEEWQLVTTPSQARTLLDNLVRSGLVHRFPLPGRGSLTYYSKTLKDEQIAERLIARAQRTAANPRLKLLGENLQRAKRGLPLLGGDTLLSGEDPEKPPLNTTSPLNSAITALSPPSHHHVATPSPLNAASNASLNATENAPLNADDKDFPVSIESDIGKTGTPKRQALFADRLSQWRKETGL